MTTCDILLAAHIQFGYDKKNTSKGAAGVETKIVLDANRTAPEAVIYAPAVTDEVLQAQRLLRGDIVNGYDGDQIVRLHSDKILRIYSEKQRIYAQTESGIYQLRYRLYELEAMLDPRRFLRISNAEIVRGDAILRLDLSAGGTIGVELIGGVRTFVSRRYVKRIKENLGL
ncbi:MAG: LytTR family transcriptional regulator [Oscillospiraceae bacterium]|nr:LytTR family transcriptional regulator [Oscillospiraceae bacterium]